MFILRHTIPLRQMQWCYINTHIIIIIVVVHNVYDV